MPINVSSKQLEQILFEEAQAALLAEGRKDDAKKKYPDLDKGGYVDSLSLEDPSGNNVYLAWMLKQTAKFFKDESSYAQREQFIAHILNAVRSFHANKQRLKKKDINQYTSVSDLNNILSQLGDTSKEAKKKKSAQAAQESDVLLKNNDFFIVRPESELASCYYAPDVKWCTAATKSKNYFNSYVSGEQDGDPRAFVYARMAHLQDDQTDKVIALVYDSNGEVESVWNAPNDAVDEDYFIEVVGRNIFAGLLGERGLGAYNHLNRVPDTSKRAMMTDDELAKIANYLNTEYEEEMTEYGFNEVPVGLDDNWQNDTRDGIENALEAIGRQLILKGSESVADEPPALRDDVWDKLTDGANKKLSNFHVSVESDGYGDVRFDATMNINIEIPGIEDADEDQLKQLIGEVVDEDAPFYLQDDGGYDDDRGIGIDTSDGELSISLTVQTHNPNNYGEHLYSPGPDGFESLVYELDRWDDSHDDILNAIVEKFSINGVIKGPAATRSQDTITYLEQTLKNFDQIDIEKNEITAWGDMNVQLLRVPKSIQDLSKKMGTANNPGPLYNVKPSITGMARGRDETLLDFITQVIRSELKRREYTQPFKSGVHRVFAAASNFADKQVKLDLREEEDPYIMADVSFGPVVENGSYDPISGKARIPFYVDFKAQQESTWNIKFMELADKYFNSIEDAFEVSMNRAVENVIRRQEEAIKYAIEQAKEKEAEEKQQTAIDAERESWADAMNEHFNNWRKFLK